MNHNLDAIPPGFKIFSERPELKIKYRSQPNGCLVIFMLPFVIMFIIHIICIPYFLVSAVNGWQPWQTWWEPFVMIFAFLLLGFITYYFLWNTFGVTTFVISPYRLTIDKELFGMHLTKNIPSANIHYFRRVQDGGEGIDSFPTWGLELINNKMKNYILMDRQISPENIDWLGRVLAEFYRVEFRPTTNRE